MHTVPTASLHTDRKMLANQCLPRFIDHIALELHFTMLLHRQPPSPPVKAATNAKRDFAKHGVLHTENGKVWEVPDHGILRVHFVEEPTLDRSPVEVKHTLATHGTAL